MPKPPEKITRRDFVAGAALLAASCSTSAPPSSKRPNILLAYADDVSWPHMGAYGARGLDTPAFDRVAAEGALFHHSYTAAPSCTPSRSCILAGRQLYQMREAGVLIGTFPPDIPLYTDLLADAGYHVGYTAKGWGPGVWDALGRTRYPCGEAFNERRYAEGEIREGLNPHDYAESFRDFLAARPAGAPFCFWFGATEAHRAYAKGAGVAAGKKLEDVDVPAFFPDVEEIRSDWLDYYMEIEWFDQHLGRMLAMLEEAGELDDTIVVVTSDNGMPFPRCKTTLYDWGARMPCAVRWGARVAGGQVIDELIHHTDFAPTFLDAAGLSAPKGVAGRSLLSLLTGEGPKPAEREFIVSAVERHTWCRPDGVPYPSRMIRTKEFLYIRNYEPERWPAGDPDYDAVPQGFFGDIDRCPTKTFMMEARERFPKQFELGFGKRPAEELYRPADDPDQVRNLAADPAFESTRAELAAKLEQYLVETGDPRADGRSPWDDYPYYAGEHDPRGRV